MKYVIDVYNLITGEKELTHICVNPIDALKAAFKLKYPGKPLPKIHEGKDSIALGDEFACKKPSADDASILGYRWKEIRRMQGNDK